MGKNKKGLKIDKKENLLQKKGLYVLRELFLELGNKINIKDFFKRLNEISYYNIFYRVKEIMESKGLLRIEHNDGIKKILLTEDGVVFMDKLDELIELIN